MADEVTYINVTGRTLTANVYSKDGGTVRQSGISLTEVQTGYYTGDCATIQPDDRIVIIDSGNIIGGGFDAQSFIKNILEGDASIDKTTTPWQLVVKIKSTSTELIRKNLFDVDGTNLTDETTIVGRQVEP